MKHLSFLFAFLFICCVSFSQEKDYTQYHKDIIKAEYEIFVANDSIKGLQIFAKTLDAYDFVFVDDCIEAFQLALVFKKEDLAMRFIKKALENGFELKLLDALSLGCPCDFYSQASEYLSIHKPFIDKNKAYLEKYATACYPKYIKRINGELLAQLIKRHVREQLFKNGHAGLRTTFAEQQKEYFRITDENLAFMDSLAKKKVFLGERNLGIYTAKLAEYLHMPFRTIENCLAELLKFYDLPANTYVPINTEADYFEVDPVYNMLFHNTRSYLVLAPYKDEAIRQGYLHPREYASLRYNDAFKRHAQQLYLQPSKRIPVDTAGLDDRRRQLLLPSYAIDYNKHRFAHKHNIHLFFGFRNGTK